MTFPCCQVGFICCHYILLLVMQKVHLRKKKGKTTTTAFLSQLPDMGIPHVQKGIEPQRWSCQCDASCSIFPFSEKLPFHVPFTMSSAFKGPPFFNDLSRSEALCVCNTSHAAQEIVKDILQQGSSVWGPRMPWHPLTDFLVPVKCL